MKPFGAVRPSPCGNPEAVSERAPAAPALAQRRLLIGPTLGRGRLLIGPWGVPQDLEGKIIVDELKQEVISTSSKAEPPQCTSLAWSADGQVGATPHTPPTARGHR